MTPMPLYLDVVCPADWCPVGGTPRRVYLQLVALDVVQMPYLRCRQCGCDMFRKDAEDMPKITRHGGASNAAADRENDQLNPPTEAVPETPVGGGSAAAPAPVVVEESVASTTTAPDLDGDQADECEGGEQPSAGSSSATSSPKPPKNSEPTKAAPQKRARTTASRSGKGRAGSSTARSTGGSGRETPSGDD